jgi:hypothetical protein
MKIETIRVLLKLLWILEHPFVKWRRHLLEDSRFMRFLVLERLVT